MKIYITGCAKSGTTLLRRCMWAFEGVEVIGREINLPAFIQYETKGAPVLVGKRTAWTIYSNKLNLHSFYHQHRLIKSNGVKTLNIIRTRRGALRSGYVTAERWEACIRQATQPGYEPDLNVDYEKLLEDPDYVQLQIADAFGLKIKAPFSHYPEFLPDNMGEPAFLTGPQYELRPIKERVLG